MLHETLRSPNTCSSVDFRPWTLPLQLQLRLTSEASTIYAGNEYGDIVALHLSSSELTALTEDKRGPVACQRRANHNPYRAVRVKLTTRQAEISLRAAYRAQRKTVGAGRTGLGAHGVTRETNRYRRPDPGLISQSVMTMALSSTLRRHRVVQDSRFRG